MRDAQGREKAVRQALREHPLRDHAIRLVDAYYAGCPNGVSRPADTELREQEVDDHLRAGLYDVHGPYASPCYCAGCCATRNYENSQRHASRGEYDWARWHQGVGDAWYLFDRAVREFEGSPADDRFVEVQPSDQEAER